jgi:hypothetical protein
MREYQQKYIVRRLIYSRVTIVVLFLLAMFLLRSIMELNEKRIAVSKLQQESELVRSDLAAKVKKAGEKNDAISTDRGFETYVRTTYPVVKDGEGVIVIYDEGKSPVSPVRSTITVWEKFIIFCKRLISREEAV